MLEGGSVGVRTFPTIGELDVCRSLLGSKGVEKFTAVGTDAECKSSPEPQTYHRADSDVRRELAGRGIESIAIGLGKTRVRLKVNHGSKSTW